MTIEIRGGGGGGGIVTPVSVANGGTGAANEADARENLGLEIGADVQAYVKDNYAAGAAPTVNDDSTAGYSQGSKWYDVTADPNEAYLCSDATPGAAKWHQITVDASDLGTMAVQDADDVTISGGTIHGLDQLSVAGLAANQGPTFGPQLISGADSWTSTGWTGDWSTGWTHTTGNTDPLILETALTQGTRYYISVVASGASSGTTATVSIDGRTYSALNPSLSWGFVIAGAGQKITVTPDIATYNGKVVITLYEYTAAVVPYTYVGTNEMEVRAPYYLGGISSSFVGRAAGAWCSGRQNTGYGLDCLTQLTTGSFNTAYGYNALQKVDTGLYNIGIGRAAARSITTATRIIAVGDAAFRDHVSGSDNIGIGSGPFYRNISGASNIGIGYRVCFLNLGDRNIGIGSGAGYYNTGSGCIVIGYQAGSLSGGADAAVSDLLLVDNTRRNDPLIRGDFAGRTLKINGAFDAASLANDAGSFSADASGNVKTNNLSNRNILINTNGANAIINQRGIADDAAVSTGDYTADRWKIVHDVTTCDYRQQATGFGLTVVTAGAGTSAALTQSVEQATSYAGKTLTFTARVKSNAAVTLVIDDGVGTTASTAHTGGGAFETLTVTRTLDASPTKLEASVKLVAGIADGKYIECEWIKLEEGSVATPWLVPDATEEARRCRRFYNFIGGSASIGIRTIGAAATQIYTTIGFAEMREAPAASISGTWAVGNCSQPVVGGAGVSSLLFTATATADGDAYAYCDSADDGIILDAEL